MPGKLYLVPLGGDADRDARQDHVTNFPPDLDCVPWSCSVETCVFQRFCPGGDRRVHASV